MEITVKKIKTGIVQLYRGKKWTKIFKEEFSIFACLFREEKYSKGSFIFYKHKSIFGSFFACGITINNSSKNK
ncbi:hypothetical protein IDM30_20215 [Acinetobacter seifertii]|nr:hypothetical protein [Acinetobacter seifertii]